MKPEKAWSVQFHASDGLLKWIFASEESAKRFIGTQTAKIIPVLITPLNK